MLWSMIRLIFKTSSVTPDFFYVFNLILSFSTCSKSFEKICAWELLGANVLKYGDFHEKLNFLKIQDLRPLNTCQKHVEMILPNFPLDKCEI